MFEMETNLYSNKNFMSKMQAETSKSSRAKLKRKRPSDVDLNTLYDEWLSSSLSSSSQSSSSSSLDNQLDELTPRRNPHKILVTEEKMANALKELQLQSLEQEMLNTEDNKQENQSDKLNTNLILPDIKSNRIYITNELKEILNNNSTHNLTDLDLNKLIEQQNKMQLIPYMPITIPESVPIYKVEEPSEVQKNQLKRTYSQVNKISIEELNSSCATNNANQSQANEYQVDEWEEDLSESKSDKLMTNNQMESEKTKPHFTIIELNEPVNDEEMEI